MKELRVLLPGTRMALLFALLLLLASATEGRSYTVEDELGAASANRGFLSPVGGRIIVEYSRPWKERCNPGIIDRTADPLGSATLLASNFKEPAKVRQLLSGKGCRGYWVDAISPDGRRAAISWIEHRSQKAGIVDLSSGGLRTLPFLPYLSWFQTRPIWISSDEIIYASVKGETVSARYFHRIAVANRLVTMWDRSSRGREQAVTVVRSGGLDDGRVYPAQTGALVRVNVRTGAITTLRSGVYCDLMLSPDHQHLAALKLGAPVQPFVGSLQRGDMERRQTRLVIFDLRNGAGLEICRKCIVAVDTLKWTADSTHLLAFTRQESESWRDGQFIRYDVNKRQLDYFEHQGLDLVSEGEQSTAHAHRPEAAAWVSGQLIVFARPKPMGGTRGTLSEGLMADPAAGPRPDWFSVSEDGRTVDLTKDFATVSPDLLSASSSAVFILADGAVWKVIPGTPPQRVAGGAAAGQPLEVFRIKSGGGTDYDLGVFQRQASGYPEVALRTAAGNRDVLLLNVETGAERWISAPSRSAEVMSISVPSKAALFFESNKGSATITLSRVGQAPVKMLQINAYLSAMTPARRIPVHYAFAGADLVGCAALPPNWRRGHPMPTIVELYPNWNPACDPSAQLDPAAELFTSWGYVYFEPQTPRNVIRGPDGPIEHITRDMLAGTEALVAQGYADPKRLGLFGESQGGFAVPFALTQTDTFAAAIACNGGSDHGSLYGEEPIAISVLPEEWFVEPSTRYEDPLSDFYLGGTPWEHPEAYIRNSAYYNAGKIRTPLLLINSDLDFFPSSQYEELFSALYRQRKTAEFVRYWGEGHELTSPANVRDRWRRMRQWFDEYLMRDVGH